MQGGLPTSRRKNTVDFTAKINPQSSGQRFAFIPEGAACRWQPLNASSEAPTEAGTVTEELPKEPITESLLLILASFGKGGGFCEAKDGGLKKQFFNGAICSGRCPHRPKI